VLRIVIADPNRAARQRLQNLLQSMEIVWLRSVCLGYQAVVEEVRRARADVVLISLDDCPDEAIETVGRLAEAYPDLTIVVMSTDYGLIRRAQGRGATRFLTPPIEAGELQPILEELSAVDEPAEEDVSGPLFDSSEELCRQLRDHQHRAWALQQQLEKQHRLLAARPRSAIANGSSHSRLDPYLRERLWTELPGLDEEARREFGEPVSRSELESLRLTVGQLLGTLSGGSEGRRTNGRAFQQTADVVGPRTETAPLPNDAGDVLDAIQRLEVLRRHVESLLSTHEHDGRAEKVPPQIARKESPAPPSSPETARDWVECTVFAPSAITPGATTIIQVFAHTAEQADAAAESAKKSDDEADQRGSKTLDAEIERGTKLTFHFTMPGTQIDQGEQHLVWRGQARAVQFDLTVPENHRPQKLVGTVAISQDAVPLGHIKFFLRIEGQATEEAPPKPERQADAVCRYKKAFISYASKDRTEVVKRVQMLRQFGIDFFQDVLRLEPGERWEKQLYEEIDKCDLFLLFWSKAAKASKWVKAEVQKALERKGKNELAPPEIKPIPLEKPLPKPPPDLAHLHFGDYLLYLIED
jgi:DNA-binding NarL/FixJ family response regulator